MRSIRNVALALALLFSASAHAQFGNLFSGLFKADAPKYAPTTPQKPQPIMVRVTYPLKVASGSEAEIRRLYEQRTIPGVSCQSDCEKNDAAFNSAIVKTSFFAAQLARHLASRLPEGGVVLTPGILSMSGSTLGYDYDGKDIPSVIDVDIFFYVQPRRETKTGIPPASTYGPVVRAVVEVRSSREAAPGSGGLLASTSDVLAYERSESDSYGVFPRLLGENTGGHAVESAKSQRPATLNSTFQFTFADEVMSKEQWESMKAASNSAAEKPPAALQAIGDVVVDLLNVIDHEKATEGARSRYARIFDKKLDGQSLTPEQTAARMSVIRKFEEREAKDLRDAQSHVDTMESYKSIQESVRKLVDFEWEHYDKIQELSRARTVSTFMAIVGAAYGGSRGVDMSGLTQTFMTSMNAMEQEQSTAVSSLGEMSSSLTGIQRSVLLEFGDQRENVVAKTRQELRAGLQAIYRKFYPE